MAEDIVKRLIEELEIASSIQTAGTIRDGVREIEKLRGHLSTSERDMRDACDRINRLRCERDHALNKMKSLRSELENERQQSMTTIKRLQDAALARDEARRELKETEDILDANNRVITDMTNQVTDLKMKLRQLLRLSQTMGEIAAEK